jgi:hypothetical protein
VGKEHDTTQPLGVQGRCYQTLASIVSHARKTMAQSDRTRGMLAASTAPAQLVDALESAEAEAPLASTILAALTECASFQFFQVDRLRQSL